MNSEEADQKSVLHTTLISVNSIRVRKCHEGAVMQLACMGTG